MKLTTLYLAISLSLFSTAFGQTKKDCFEIKHLDFFHLDSLPDFQWPVETIDQMLQRDLTELGDNKDLKTSFLIPYIIIQLKEFYPVCSAGKDTAIYNKLTQLYFKIRHQDISTLKGKPRATQLETIRQDYYLQLENDSLLPFMNFTLDDGPFYGEVPADLPEYKNGKAYKMDFGTLYITEEGTKVYISVIDKEHKHLWTKLMTGDSNRPMGTIMFYEEKIYRSSLGYQLRMYSGGEALNLYLRPNGEFRFYYHSW